MQEITLRLLQAFSGQPALFKNCVQNALMQDTPRREVTLEEIHHRQIDLRFYKRSDGLYEVIGRLVDTKSHPFQRPLVEQPIPPGTPVHDIRVHLVVDEELLVHDAFADMKVTPFAICPGATQALPLLKGLRIGGGWNKKVRELLGGAVSCTHVVEMLGPMATTAYQGIAPKRLARMASADGDQERLDRIDSCYSFGAQREIVARLWPQLKRENPLG